MHYLLTEHSRSEPSLWLPGSLTKRTNHVVKDYSRGWMASCGVRVMKLLYLHLPLFWPFCCPGPGLAPFCGDGIIAWLPINYKQGNIGYSGNFRMGTQTGHHLNSALGHPQRTPYLRPIPRCLAGSLYHPDPTGCATDITQHPALQSQTRAQLSTQFLQNAT